MTHRPPGHCEDTEEVYPCMFNTSGTALCADLLVFSSTMGSVAINSKCVMQELQTSERLGASWSLPRPRRGYDNVTAAIHVQVIAVRDAANTRGKRIRRRTMTVHMR